MYDCGDTDENGISDDNCRWFDCDGGYCVVLPRIFADAGGAYGECRPDGFCNIHDANHALNCFNGTNTCDPVNIDIGGNFGACEPDGYCNIHDARAQAGPFFSRALSPNGFFAVISVFAVSACP